MNDPLLRWRLVLGPDAGDSAPLEGRLAEIDEALGFVYDGGRDASLAPSRPSVPPDLAGWLLRLRRIFPEESVAFVQKEALERRGWAKLLFEPEALARLDRNLDLVKLILASKDLIPDRARDMAREIVRDVAAKLRAKLETGMRSALVGALRRNRRSVLPVAANVDWRRTIARNLRNWVPERRVLVPERIHFSARELRRRDWKVVLLVDQSASMATSVIHSSILASVLASLDVVRTHLVLFDASVVDLTPHLDDPVEILFGARLGGGTDIAHAVEYGASLVETPDRTLLILVSDLREGGDRGALLARLERLARDRVRVLCVLALDDSGAAAYDPETAREVAALGIPAFACTPGKLVEAMERVLSGGTP